MGWAATHLEFLLSRPVYATATTGTLLRARLGLPIRLLHSGPQGGDQQIGAYIARGAINGLFFFWDPLTTHAHGDDVRALLRLATLRDIYVACGPTTATAIASQLSSRETSPVPA
ncbi:methylglyoxal synthase [Allocatelliglobosispora scoriae]|uniref:Methylglyoxal synthase n=2 Tax=Allocatelliglobosispora scoriae TaxID=643052 RepID=A0A841BKK7_9ACTN|nr:methylglyoxal synthase [Allocatelliglobosispora scoriae]